MKVFTWHFASGTRRLPGSDGAAPKPPPSRGGPEYLEFREESSTTYQAGILTLVPVAALRKLDYDYEKKTVKAVVAVAHGLLLQVYQVLQTQQPLAQAPSSPLDEQRRKRIVRHHLRCLGRLGISTGPKRISAHGIVAKPGRPKNAKNNAPEATG